MNKSFEDILFIDLIYAHVREKHIYRFSLEVFILQKCSWVIHDLHERVLGGSWYTPRCVMYQGEPFQYLSLIFYIYPFHQHAQSLESYHVFAISSIIPYLRWHLIEIFYITQDVISLFDETGRFSIMTIISSRFCHAPNSSVAS